MAQLLRALAVLWKDLSSAPSIHFRWFTTACDFNFRVSSPNFYSLKSPGTHIVHRHTHRQNTHKHKTNKTLFKKQKQGQRDNSAGKVTHSLTVKPSLMAGAHIKVERENQLQPARKLSSELHMVLCGTLAAGCTCTNPKE